jgi:hypothetical protein
MVMWRLPFPADVTASVISTSNPFGTLTNSDLEHAALVCHSDVPTQVYDI